MVKPFYFTGNQSTGNPSQGHVLGFMLYAKHKGAGGGGLSSLYEMIISLTTAVPPATPLLPLHACCRNAGEKEKEVLCGESVDWFSHSAKQYGDFSEN